MLAEKFNVNMSTVRRAFKELKISGIVDKKIGSGTYLRRLLNDNWEDKPVNIVLPVHGNAVTDEVALRTPLVAARHKRKHHIIYTTNTELPELIRSFILHNQPAILLGIDSPETQKEIMKIPWLFVVLAKSLDQRGIPSVTCDDSYGIRILMNYLEEFNHRRIAIFYSHTDDPMEEMQHAIYKTCIAKYYTPDLSICANICHEKDPMDTAYEAMLSAAEKTNFSALLCLNDEIMLGALAALYTLGKRVPEDVSVVSIGNTRLSRYSCPPVSCYDPNLEQHLNQAFLLLEKNCRTPDNCEKLRLVNPVLIKRNSVKNNKGSKTT
jgi:DNA-binding LacI/PurR family transcriptional regulator